MTVVGVDRNGPGLEQLPDAIIREVTDATEPNAAVPMVERIVRDVGTPDTLVNTIGAFQPGDALATTPELLRQMIDVNLGSALWLSQAVAPYMQRKLRPLGIRVNCVVPQLLDTATARASLPKEVLAHAVAPEAIAEVVSFLVSGAAAPISGAILPAYGA